MALLITIQITLIVLLAALGWLALKKMKQYESMAVRLERQFIRLDNNMDNVQMDNHRQRVANMDFEDRLQMLRRDLRDIADIRDISVAQVDEMCDILPTRIDELEDMIDNLKGEMDQWSRLQSMKHTSPESCVSQGSDGLIISASTQVALPPRLQ